MDQDCFTVVSKAGLEPDDILNEIYRYQALRARLYTRMQEAVRNGE